MEEFKFKEFMVLVETMDAARTILEIMSEGYVIDISRYNGGTHLCIDRNSPLYTSLEKILKEFVEKVEARVEML